MSVPRFSLNQQVLVDVEDGEISDLPFHGRIAGIVWERQLQVYIYDIKVESTKDRPQSLGLICSALESEILPADDYSRLWE